MSILKLPWATCVFLSIVLCAGAAAHAQTPTKKQVPASNLVLPVAFHHIDASGPGAAVRAEQQWWKSFNDAQLDALIAVALRDNPALKVAEARLREARAAMQTSKARQAPEINAASAYQRTRGPVNALGFLRPGQQINIFQVDFDASWELDFFGGVKASVAAANADARGAEESRRDAIVSLLAEVARGYIALRGAQQELEVTRKNVVSQNEFLELTRVRAEAGLATELDVQRAAAQLEATRAALPLLETESEQTIHSLSILLGKEPGELQAGLVVSAAIPAAATPLPGLPADLLRRRPDIRRAEVEVAAAFARTKAAQAERFPKFNLTSLLGRQGSTLNSFSFGAGNFFALGPSVTLPIFNRGRIRADIERRGAQQEAAQREFDRLVLQALREVEDAMSAEAAERARKATLMKAVQANRQAVQLAEELFRLGQETFLSVLDAQRRLYETETQLVQSERAISLQVVALYKALGGGWGAPAR